MKRFIPLLLSLLLFSSLSARTVTRQLTISSPFSSVSVANGIDVTFSPIASGNATAVATGDSRFMDFFEMQISKGTLVIRLKEGRSYSSVDVKVALSAPLVNEVKACSGASFSCSAPVSLGRRDLELETSSAGSISFGSVACAEADIEAESAGQIKLASLVCSDADIEASSSAKVTVSALSSPSVSIDSSSAASITASGIQAQKLECKASSAASAVLSGTAASASCRASSSASVNISRLKAGSLSQHASSGASILK